MKKSIIALGLLVCLIVGIISLLRLNRLDHGKSDQTFDDKPDLQSETRKQTTTLRAESKSQDITATQFMSSGAVKASENTLLAPFFQRSVHLPSLEAIQSLKASDAPVLMAYYRAHTNLLDRNLVIHALGQVGSDEAADLFVYTLTNEYSGCTITASEVEENEELVMENIVYSLGFLAQRSEKAWKFVQDGLDPWFWKRSIPWKSSLEADTYGILAGRCFEAIAISGRPEAEQILNSLKDKPLINDTDPDPTRRTLDGAVMQAAFYHWVVKEEGIDGLTRYFFGPEARSDTFDDDHHRVRWKASEGGKKWKAWYEAYKLRVQK